jgi:hypothetical protein
MLIQSPKYLFATLILVLTIVPASLSQVSTKRNLQHQQQTATLTEEFSFVVKDFKVEHQSEHNVLNIAVTMRYVPNVKNTDYPDYRAVAKDIENFLTNYPNEQDYWEIVNKAVTSMLLKKYPSVAVITCEIAVEPVPNSPYTRSSRVTRSRSVTAKRK